MGMVFQNDALFPTVRSVNNVAFGLRMRGMDRGTIARKITDALAQVELVGYEDRRPGPALRRPAAACRLGPRHRHEPRVLLCDERSAALDKKLRQTMPVRN